MTSRRIRVGASAKVNLTLEVLGRRADGYHELASVVATVDLWDDVRVALAKTLDVRIRPDVGAPPGDDLASHAVRAFALAVGREPRAHVLVRKRIPAAAGLGGGSSDAGAVLRALAALWHVTDVDLTGIGASVGSDVPFFVSGRAAARVGGRGERVDPLPAPDELWVALVTLPHRLRTADVFTALHATDRGDGRATSEVADMLERRTIDVPRLRAIARNDLLRAAQRICPAIADARTLASARGIDLALSGSGPSLFAIADGRADAMRVARSLRRAGLRARARRVAVPPSMLLT